MNNSEVSPTPLRSAGFVLARRETPTTPVEFLLMRNATHGSWGFPKGTLDPGETPREAAWRELAEETGLRPEDVRLVNGVETTIAYTVPADTWGPGNPATPTPKEATYYLALLSDTQRLSPSQEHSEVKWCVLEEAKRRLERTPQLAQLLEQMAPHLETSP